MSSTKRQPINTTAYLIVNGDGSYCLDHLFLDRSIALLERRRWSGRRLVHVRITEILRAKPKRKAVKRAR